MFGKFGIGELIIILVIVLVVFGVGKLPQIGGAIGKSIREFRSAQRGEGEEATPKKEEATKNVEGKDTSVLK